MAKGNGKNGAGVARITIVGAVSDEPVVHNADDPEKTTLCSFCVMTKIAAGNKEETHFHNVTVWGDIGAKLGKKLEKDDLVRVEGRLGAEKRESEEHGTYWQQRINVDDDFGSAKLGDSDSSHENTVELVGECNRLTYSRPGDGEDRAHSLKLDMKTVVPIDSDRASTGFHKIWMFDKVAATAFGVVSDNPHIRALGRVRRVPVGKDAAGNDKYEPAVIIDEALD